ncbi:STELLO glycosyltransferase family protein [Thermodesulfobacteriota bacterium]
MIQKNVLVITTIMPPTKSISQFSKFREIRIVVVGDKKTPSSWEHPKARFLSIEEQGQMGYEISKSLPYNHYARKMIGYLYAIKTNAQTIIDTDDDNIPKDNWQIPENGKYETEYLTTPPDLGFINIYRNYTKYHIWPRGFPLGRIMRKDAVINKKELLRKKTRVGIWQGLADGDPDVDAIYRLTINAPCYFKDKEPVVLDKGTLCPINSQNTIFPIKALFPLLYLPAFVSFRFTDILRGLVAQPIMWAAGYLLGFTTSTVIQERNPHDYMNDFELEIPCYLLTEKIIDIVSNAVRESLSVSDNLYESYIALQKADIVTKEELDLLSKWLKDIV